jgi:CRP-like cAMP-binding protein
MKDIPSILPASGVLAGVSSAAREALSCFGSFASHAKGGIIVEQASAAASLHIVVDGELQVTLRTPEELVPLGYVQAGETVGEMGFLDPEAITSAAVTARMASIVWSISTADFEEFLSSHPVAGTEILKAILRLVGRRARRGNERLADEVADDDDS